MQQTKKQKNLSNLTVGKCDISTDYPIISATKNTSLRGNSKGTQFK